MSLSRSTGLRQRSLDTSCRRCGLSYPAVRFPALRHRLCLSCSPIDATPAPKRPKRPKLGDSQPFLAYVRSLPCSCRGKTCLGPIQAHHLRTAANSGTSIKPQDIGFCAPLCLGHHHEFHLIGRHTFAEKYGVDLTEIAAKLGLIFIATNRPLQI